MINELQKVGFKTMTNQEEKTWTQDEELRIQMEIKSLKESQKQKEQEVRNELQTFYNQKLGNLEEAINRQKQANEEANKQALVKIDKQQEEIKTLQKSYNIINYEKERQQQKIQAIIISKDELEHELQNKDMEIECHNQQHEINTHKIK